MSDRPLGEETELDRLDDEVGQGIVSPVSGIGSAIGAGDVLGAGSRRRVMVELPAYLCVQAAWFTAFGMQTVIFPYLLKNVMGVAGYELGLAQMALAAPSVVFILLGGVVAERAEGRALLFGLHLAAAVPALLLGFSLRAEWLFYWQMLAYAVAMGTIGAFMLPARDAILNTVIDRRRLAGSKLTLQQGVAFATLVQFAAQIVGLWTGGMATAKGVWPLLVAQAAVLLVGAIAAAFLHRTRTTVAKPRARGAVLRDIAEGLRAVKSCQTLMPMVALQIGLGVFVIGAFLVVLPIINADVYGHDSRGLRDIFVTFWAGAFVSSAAISRVRVVERPGRLLIVAQALAAASMLVVLGDTPYWAFLTLVFTWGLASGVSIMMSRSIVQSSAPPHLLARVLSIYQLGFMGGAPVGAALMGALSDKVGPHLVVIFPAAGMLGMLAWLVLATPIWKMDPPAEAKPAG